MKIKIFIIAIAGLILASCEDFLNKEPLGQQTYEDFLEKAKSNSALLETNIEALLVGAYDLFNWDENSTITLHHGDWQWDMLSDDEEKGGDGKGDISGFNDWRTWSLAPGTQSAHISAFTVGVTAVNRANDVLKEAEKFKEFLSETSYNRFVGEAKFIRAYFYFYMAKIFGSVPYISDSGLVDIKMAPEPLYAKIVEDLLDAEQKVATVSDWRLVYKKNPNGRCTKGAIQAILARVYMMEIGFEFNGREWSDVYELTSKIIDSGNYSLMSNYAAIFELEAEFSPEQVFEIECVDFGQPSGGTKQNLAVTMTTSRLTAGSNTGKSIYSGWGFGIPTKNLVEEFEPNDPRLECTVVKSGDIIYEDGNPNTNEQINIKVLDIRCPTGYFQRKNTVPVSQTPSFQMITDKDKYPVRYSDVLLMHAEAAYYLDKEDEARTMVNKVRERARNSTPPKGSRLGNAGYPAKEAGTSVLPDVTASGEELLAAIKKERRVELATEGHRTWDLYRWGEYKDAIRRYVPDDMWIKSEDPEAVVARFESHLIGNVPCLPIPSVRVEQGIPQNPAY